MYFLESGHYMGQVIGFEEESMGLHVLVRQPYGSVYSYWLGVGVVVCPD